MRGLTERHNADPVASGDCCTWCNERVVLPHRASEASQQPTLTEPLVVRRDPIHRVSAAPSGDFAKHELGSVTLGLQHHCSADSVATGR